MKELSKNIVAVSFFWSLNHVQGPLTHINEQFAGSPVDINTSKEICGPCDDPKSARNGETKDEKMHLDFDQNYLIYLLQALPHL